jgi:ankyrin repeat protein
MIPNNSNQAVVNGVNAFNGIMSDGGQIPEKLLEILCETLTIQRAIMTKNIQLITRVIEVKSSEINSIDEYGMSTLHHASSAGNLEICNILIENGADLKLEHDDGINALHYASINGHLDVVKRLIGLEPNLIDKKTKQNLTAYDIALKQGHQDVCNYLREVEEDLEAKSAKIDNKPSEEKISDAWELCKKGQFEDLKLLIEADRSILFDHKYSEATMAAGGGSSEKTLFQRLAENGSDEAIEILRENSVSALFNQTCIIKYRFQQEIAGEAEGITALYLAVQKGRKAMVEFLITQSDVDCVVTKNPEDGDQRKYSLLEGAVKEANLKGGDSFEILKIITGDNPNGKKANFYSFRLTEDEKQNQKVRIAGRFQFYSEEVKALLRDRYPTEIEEIEKMSDEKRGPEPSPSHGGASKPGAGIILDV